MVRGLTGLDQVWPQPSSGVATRAESSGAAAVVVHVERRGRGGGGGAEEEGRMQSSDIKAKACLQATFCHVANSDNFQNNLTTNETLGPADGQAAEFG